MYSTIHPDITCSKQFSTSLSKQRVTILGQTGLHVHVYSPHTCTYCKNSCLKLNIVYSRTWRLILARIKSLPRMVLYTKPMGYLGFKRSVVDDYRSKIKKQFNCSHMDGSVIYRIHYNMLPLRHNGMTHLSG